MNHYELSRENNVNVQHKGVISEGQTTETPLCMRTIVISENRLRSHTNAFELSLNVVFKLCLMPFSLRFVNKHDFDCEHVERQTSHRTVLKRV